MHGAYTHKLCDGMYARVHVQRSVSLHVVEGTGTRVHVQRTNSGASPHLPALRKRLSTDYSRLAIQWAFRDYLSYLSVEALGYRQCSAGDSKPDPQTYGTRAFYPCHLPSSKKLLQLRELGWVVFCLLNFLINKTTYSSNPMLATRKWNFCILCAVCERGLGTRCEGKGRGDYNIYSPFTFQRKLFNNKW